MLIAIIYTSSNRYCVYNFFLTCAFLSILPLSQVLIFAEFLLSRVSFKLFIKLHYYRARNDIFMLALYPDGGVLFFAKAIVNFVHLDFINSYMYIEIDTFFYGFN